jgi:GT2 family glycosyltransferase
VNYAAFIITYKRPEILKKTIGLLFSQTMPPKKILIVDNDIDETARQVKNAYSDSLVAYFPVGSNSGPAGGAYWGLKILFEEGWEWVLWVDDDDPPSAPNQIETICNLGFKNQIISKVGMVGASGVLFDRKKWLIKRLLDKSLNGSLDVDMVAGNQFPLVHKSVYDVGILPNPDLFFGFEDLEYCYRIKNAGFRILVDGDEILRLRKMFKKFNNKKLRGGKKKLIHLWREYYSMRTLAFMIRSEKSYILKSKFYLRCIFKSVISFRFGIKYFFMLSKFNLLGCWHGFKGKLNIYIIPNKKY